MGKKAVHQGLILCLSLVTLYALSIQFNTEAYQPTRLLPYPETWALATGGLFLLYRAWLGRPRSAASLTLWLLAGLFAGVATLAQSFSVVGTAELITGSIISLIKAGLFWVGRMPLYYAILWLLGQKLGEKRGTDTTLFASVSTSSRWLLYTGLLLVCWLPYYLAVFPGVVSNDSVTQLKEIFGVKDLSAGNPVFQTGLVWLCVQAAKPFGNGDVAVALYCTVQGMLMALLLGYALDRLRREGAPPWLRTTSFLFYALCPIFPLYAFCVGKDTNFAMGVLWLFLMVWRVLSQPKEKSIPVRVVVGLCLSAALVTLLRNPGVYLAGLTLLLLLLWGMRNPWRKARRWRGPALALTGLLIVYVGVNALVIPLLKIAPMPETEEYSLPLQQVARVLSSQPERLSEEELVVIDAVLKTDAVKGAYNGELSDPVKLLWREEATETQKSTFFRQWLRLSPRFAATYFSATFHNTYGYLYPGYVSLIKPTLLIGKQAHTTEIDSYFTFTVSPHSSGLQAAMDALLRHSLFRMFLAPGLYGCLTVYAIGLLLSRRRGRKLLMAAFPAFFTLLGCMLSAVNGYFRYAMPLYFCAPLLLMLCACALAPWKGEESK